MDAHMNDTELKRYQLLSTGFWNVPSEAYLDELSENLPLFETGQGAAENGIAHIERYLQTRSEASVHDLAVDFTSTFIGQKSDDPFPYESIYTSEGRLLKQESCDEVCEMYRAYEFEPDRQMSNEPEDYLSTMFAFLAYLRAKELESRSVGDSDGSERYVQAASFFKENHLRNWVPQFRAEVEGKAETDFYKGLAYLAEAACE